MSARSWEDVERTVARAQTMNPGSASFVGKAKHMWRA
ncbi:hypothetical protein ACRB68_31630 [Actinomadura sp. RB68]|uniref:Uncharacterized protein n=1 Tax=Actinomadura macrotermitis TaxID=2585200 RepID=A0A7K0BVA8_9ACTN|nr:hypothetical protein [Actinomadura macrotermitis]